MPQLCLCLKMWNGTDLKLSKTYFPLCNLLFLKARVKIRMYFRNLHIYLIISKIITFDKNANMRGPHFKTVNFKKFSYLLFRPIFVFQLHWMKPLGLLPNPYACNKNILIMHLSSFRLDNIWVYQLERILSVFTTVNKGNIKRDGRYAI